MDLSELVRHYDSTTRRPVSFNVLDAGGMGATNTSVWLVVCGPAAVTGIYPKASRAEVQDWRYCVRIANIDVPDLITHSGSQSHDAPTWLPRLMLRALALIPSFKVGSPIFLARGMVGAALTVLRYDLPPLPPHVVSDEDDGGPRRFMGVPVLITEAIPTTEARVA